MRTPRLIIPLVLAALLSGLAIACGGGDDNNSATPTGSSAPSASPSATAQPSTTPVNVDDLAKAVVQIYALDSSDNPIWFGSGTVISEDGFILTNGHVVDDRQDEYDHLGVGITTAEDQAPEIKYAAKIQTVDYAIDLAVIQITGLLDGGRVLQTFPYAKVGDSNKVHIGDDIRILGYPAVGGETITLTRGSISGFTSERAVGDRAWIKTDATITGGNSGGLAVNDDGELIGVPTIVGSGADTNTVDCRNLSDTNGDGVIDSNDTCVSVGGFINGIRPVNLASDLIADAESGTEYVSPYHEETGPTPTGGFDTTSVDLSNFQFSADVTDNDQPTEVVPALPSAPTSVCAFWDYTGMQDGESWDAIWYIDGTKDDQGSIINDTWSGSESGNWWVCVTDSNGLPDGAYEVVIQVGGEVKGASSLYVGDSHKIVSVTFENQSGQEVCAIAVSPIKAQNWGGDKLALENSGTTLKDGDSKTVKLGTGEYDILAVDCNNNTIEQDADISIDSEGTFTITGSSQ